MRNSFEIEIEYNSSLHEDIKLTLLPPNEVKIIDSYYYLVNESDPSEKKLKDIVRAMMLDWKEYINQTKVNVKCFFPIDLSDEYIAGFFLNKSESLNVKYSYIRDINSLNIGSIIVDFENVEVINIHDCGTEEEFLLGIDKAVSKLS